MKPLWHSRTFWLNFLTVAAGTIGFIAGHQIIAQYPQAVACLVVAQGILGIILRLLTTKSIK